MTDPNEYGALVEQIESGTLSGPEPTDWKVGDLVTVSPFSGFPKWAEGVVYEIEKRPARANEVNYHAQPANGVGRGLQGPAYAFAAYDGPRPEKATPMPKPGTIVEVTGKAGLFVVNKVDPDGSTCTVLHVNGTGTGFRKIRPFLLTPVQVVKA